MTKEELLDKAIYIQYELKDGTFKEYNVDKEIHKISFSDKNQLYVGWKDNEHHFTTKYHREVSLPFLGKLLGFDFNINDFNIVKRKYGKFDISMLKPKKKYIYDVVCFNNNVKLKNVSFDRLITGTIHTEYHKLYKFPHSASRIINKSINSNEILFISGDSHMIPIVSALSCYFKEVWYIDNRKNIVNSNNWKDVNFTKVLVELYDKPLDYYINQNFK